MHKILFALLMLFGAVSQAQTTADTLDCVPKTWLTPTASGTQLRQGMSTGGSWWGTWCPSAAKPYVHVILNGYGWDVQRISATAIAMAAQPDPLTALRFAIEANKVPPTPADQTTWAMIKDDAVAVLAADAPVVAPPPPPVLYSVKLNGLMTTRPSYLLIDGVRGALVGRADVGQRCDTTRPTLASGASDLWAEFGPSFTPGIVALCAKP